MSSFLLPRIKPLCDRSAAEKTAAQSQDKASHQFLRDLCKLAANLECADCTAKNPGWATLPHGAFICIDCAQIHRHIGRHISQVKAINTGTYLWYPDEVKAMQTMGNQHVQAYYLGGGPPDVRALRNKPSPKDTRTVREQYIRDKYEHRRWVDHGFTLTKTAAPAATATPTPARTPSAPISPAAAVTQQQPDLLSLFSSMSVASSSSSSSSPAPLAPSVSDPLLSFPPTSTSTSPSYAYPSPSPSPYPTTQPAAPASGDFWGAFGLAPVQQHQPQPLAPTPSQPGAPLDYEQSKASILSLFDAPRQAYPAMPYYQHQQPAPMPPVVYPNTAVKSEWDW